MIGEVSASSIRRSIRTRLVRDNTYGMYHVACAERLRGDLGHACGEIAVGRLAWAANAGDPAALAELNALEA